MGTKFTPGPWAYLIKKDGYTCVGAATLIAKVYSQAYRDFENEAANAHLISAAPDLYDALKAAISHIEHMAKWIADQKAGYSFEGLGEDMSDIRAALAKARGESLPSPEGK